MKGRGSILLLALCAVACGETRDPAPANGGPDGGAAAEISCGVEGAPVADECDGFDDCGGDMNVGRRSNCAECPSEALFSTCSKGRCVEYDRSGTIRVGFNVSDLGVGANSYVVMVVDPEAADGTDVTCDALLSTCPTLDNFALNVVNVDLGEPPGGLKRDRAYTRTLSAHVGEGRLAYVKVTAGTDGNGAVVAHGCGEGAHVASGQTTDVLIELVAP